MILVLIFGLVCIAVAVGLVARALALPRQQVLEALSGIDRYGFEAPVDKGEAPRHAQLLPQLDRIASSLGAMFVARMGIEEEMTRLLRSAAVYSLTARKLLGYRILATVGCPLLWLLVARGTAAATMAIGLLLAIFAGWQGPILFLRRRSQARLDEIDFQMPELIDILVTTIEAGVGFSGSMQMAARRFKGALGAELRLTLAEQDMGLSTEEALQNMLGRADTPAVRAFVRSVLQGETLGVSIGKIMRDLAEEMRKRRRQRAEERAQKAPTKLLFPLVLLIFPAMFIVILGPAVVSVLRSLHGG